MLVLLIMIFATAGVTYFIKYDHFRWDIINLSNVLVVATCFAAFTGILFLFHNSENVMEGEKWPFRAFWIISVIAKSISIVLLILNYIRYEVP